MNTEQMCFVLLAQGQGHVEECTLLTPWLLPLRQWECLFLTGRVIFVISHCSICNLQIHHLIFYFCISKSSSTPAEDPLKLDECRLAGKYILELLKMDLKPKDIITPRSMRNAMVTVMALGGSTNAVLHLIAIAR